MPDDANSNTPKENVEVTKNGKKVIPEDFKEAFTKEDGKDVTTATLLSNEAIEEIIKKNIYKDVAEEPSLK